MSAGSRSILVVHPDPARQAALTAALAEFEVVATEDRRSAVDVLETFRPDMIIAPSRGVRPLLRDVDRLAPWSQRLVLCESEDPEALLDVAAEGHRFHALTDPSVRHVCETVRDFLAPRTTQRAGLHSELTVQFVAAGHAFS